jgi:Tfp pilus assembly protein PilF
MRNASAGQSIAQQQPGMRRSVEEWRLEAEAHEAAGRLDEAESLLGQILEARPDDLLALQQAALLSHKRKRIPEAIERLERAIALAPDRPIYHRNLCELYRSQGRLDEALPHGLSAVELAPDDVSAYYNLGVLHYDRMEIEDAIRRERRALELAPDLATAHFELAESLLLSGQFEEGWREYEHRFDLPNVPPLLPAGHRQPLWDGKPMPTGTLLLIGDQGFGDTIQFCRYIAEVAKLCPNLILAASAEMQPIVLQQPGIKQYSDRWETMPAFDAYCPLSGLPRLFRTDLGSIPAPVPYVKADPAKVAQWCRRLNVLVPKGYRRIGIVWAGRPTHGNDFNRSMKLQRLGALAKRDKTALLSLQMGPAQAEIARYFGRAPLFNLGAEIADFTDTMAIIAAIDRLVAVDTSVAHLAGAMGRPVSILLPYAPDWRWLMKRSDTPWYPTVTLCRQTAPGDWESAVASMLRTLETRHK